MTQFFHLLTGFINFLIVKFSYDSSVLRFLPIDPMVSGSNPSSAKLSLSVRRAASSLLFKAYESQDVVTSRGRT